MNTSNKHRKKRAGRHTDRQAAGHRNADHAAGANENTVKTDQNTHAFVVPWQLYDYNPYNQSTDQKLV